MALKAGEINYGNLAFAALIIGIGLSLIGVFAVDRSLSARNWKTTAGVIIESRVIDGFDSDSSKPYIAYRYEADGKSYTSSKIAFMFFTGDSFAEKAVAAYPQNKIVTVYYDPTDPAKAILEPRLSIVAVLTLIAGVLCLVFWQWARMKRKRQIGF